MGIIKSVESFDIVLTDTILSNTALLTKGQIGAKCVPVSVTQKMAKGNDRYGNKFLKVSISDTEVTIERGTAVAGIEVVATVFIVEFTDECTVQTGEAALTTRSETASPPIDFVDLSKTFVILTKLDLDTDNDFNNTMVRMSIQSETTIRFDRIDDKYAIDIRWYSVECHDTQFNVQHESIRLPDDSNEIISNPFNSVDMARTMIKATHETSENSDDPEGGSNTVDLISSTEVRVRRAYGTTPADGNNDVEFQVIEFAVDQGVSVQRGDLNIVSGIFAEVGINEVDFERTIINSPIGQANGSINTSVGTNLANSFNRFFFLDTTTIRSEVVGNFPSSIAAYEIIEWTLDTGAVTPAIIKSVENVEISIQILEDINTFELTKGQIGANCIPLVTVEMLQNTNDVAFYNRFVQAEIVGSTLTVRRSGPSSLVRLDVMVSVVEYTDACVVQSGDIVFLSGSVSDTVTPTIPFTNMARAFVYVQFSSVVDNFDAARTYMNAKIRDTTTLEFNRIDSSGVLVGKWYTVECFASEFIVQRDAFNLLGTSNQSDSSPFNSVDMARTMVIASYNADKVDGEGETVNCTINLETDTTLRARRANDGTLLTGQLNIEFQVIEFAADQNISVQRGLFVISIGSTEDTNPINQVDLSSSIVNSPAGENNTSINSIDIVTHMSSFFCKMDLQDATTVRGTIGSNSISILSAWEVVEFLVPPVVVASGIVKSVEKLLITIPIDQTTGTATLTKGQIDNKCVPFTTCAAIADNSATPSNRNVRVTISGNIVTATRTIASSNIFVDVIVSVVEYTDECTVQTGEVIMTGFSIIASPPINFVNLSKTFVYMTYTPNSSGNNLLDNYATVEIINETTLDFSRIGDLDEIICRWYSVECDGTQFEVQRGTFSFTGTDFDAQSAPFNSVDMARTMVIANFKTDENLSATEEGNCTVDLSSNTTVRAQRALGTTPINGKLLTINYQVIEFAAYQNISVQRGEFFITNVEDTNTINSVDLDLSMPHAPAGQNGGSVNSSGSTGMAQVFVKLDFVNNITVRGQVGSQETNTAFSWEAIEYGIADPTPELTRVFSSAVTNISAMI